MNLRSSWLINNPVTQTLIVKVGLVSLVSLVLMGGGTGFSQHAMAAGSKLVNFDTPAQEILYEELLEEYRCLKCQNQNLADSNAALAGDLRDEIRDQVQSGASRSEIDDYLVARYGDFVLYKPQLKASTLVLWFGPFLLLLISGWYALKIVKGHRELIAAPTTPTDDDSVAKARSLLNDQSDR